MLEYKRVLQSVSIERFETYSMYSSTRLQKYQKKQSK